MLLLISVIRCLKSAFNVSIPVLVFRITAETEERLERAF